MDEGTRGVLLSRLTKMIGLVSIAHPVRVAIDGPPAAGKTTVGDELAVALRAQGRRVVRSSIEGFLLPCAQRYQRGEYSAEGCYGDSFDFEALRRVLLDPLGPDGDRRFQRAVYDRSADLALSLPVSTAPVDAVLLFDGVFLLRPELRELWDLRIFVSTGFDVALDRARSRDTGLFGTTHAVERRYRERYRPSQQFSFDSVRPAERADVVVHNDEPARPAWEVRTS